MERARRRQGKKHGAAEVCVQKARGALFAAERTGQQPDVKGAVAYGRGQRGRARHGSKGASNDGLLAFDVGARNNGRPVLSEGADNEPTNARLQVLCAGEGGVGGWVAEGTRSERVGEDGGCLAEAR